MSSSRLQVAPWLVVEVATWRVVTCDEVKRHCRIDTKDDDAYLLTLIDAATDFAEDSMATSLVRRKLLATFYDGQNLDLPRGPIDEVVSVTDAEGVDVTDYELISVGSVTRVVLNVAAVRPVQAMYWAGYASASQIPASTRLAIMTHVATHYATRESASDRTKTVVPHSLEDFYRLKRRGASVA
jgi:uncharacterized phiE125 gp8 family phage protein